MDDKYQVPKKRKPQTKQDPSGRDRTTDKRREKTSNLAEKQTFNAEITRLFAQYERLKL